MVIVVCWFGIDICGLICDCYYCLLFWFVCLICVGWFCFG